MSEITVKWDKPTAEELENEARPFTWILRGLPDPEQQSAFIGRARGEAKKNLGYIYYYHCRHFGTTLSAPAKTLQDAQHGIAAQLMAWGIVDADQSLPITQTLEEEEPCQEDSTGTKRPKKSKRGRQSPF